MPMIYQCSPFEIPEEVREHVIRHAMKVRKGSLGLFSDVMLWTRVKDTALITALREKFGAVEAAKQLEMLKAQAVSYGTPGFLYFDQQECILWAERHGILEPKNKSASPKHALWEEVVAQLGNPFAMGAFEANMNAPMPVNAQLDQGQANPNPNAGAGAF